jgi:hypothetical protein
VAKLQLWDPGTTGGLVGLGLHGFHGGANGFGSEKAVVLRVKSTDPEESNGGGAVNGLE